MTMPGMCDWCEFCLTGWHSLGYSIEISCDLALIRSWFIYFLRQAFFASLIFTAHQVPLTYSLVMASFPSHIFCLLSDISLCHQHWPRLLGISRTWHWQQGLLAARNALLYHIGTHGKQQFQWQRTKSLGGPTDIRVLVSLSHTCASHAHKRNRSDSVDLGSMCKSENFHSDRIPGAVGGADADHAQSHCSGWCLFRALSP